MKKLYKMFLYDLKMTLRQREALFWMFLFPILLMVILGMIFGGNRQVHIKVGIVDQDNSVVSQAIVQRFQEQGGGIVITTGSEEAERKALKDGNRNGLLIIPAGFGAGFASGTQETLTMVIDQADMNMAQITRSTMAGILSSMGQQMSGAPEPVNLNEEAAQGKDFNYIDYIVPGLIAMVVMFSGLNGYAQEIAVYREKGILRRIKVSPLSLPSFLAGGISTVLLFTIAQAAALFALGIFAFKLHVAGNYFYMIVLILLGAMSFLAMGFLISSLSKTGRSAQMAGTAVGMPMMFLSGVFFPLSIMPVALKVIARVFPLYYLGDALRRVMVDSASIASVWLDVLVLIGVGIIAFIASVRFFRWE
jgi:ABC-2 type transport system permease protein